MRWLFLVATLVHTALAGDLYSPAVYGSPGLPYVTQSVAAPTGYVSSLRTSVGYGPLATARLNAVAYSPAIGVPQPVAAPLAAPVAPAVPGYSAPVLARYGAPVAPVVTKYAAVPAVADVPVTKFEAQPGFVQNYVDVAHQKIATSKLQIRRPAVQKSFYDIEERIVVRPVGSAVLEFDQPTSRSQSGPTVLRPAVARYFSSAHPIHVAPFDVTHLPPGSGFVPPQTSSEEYLPSSPSAPSSPEEPNQSYPQTEEPTSAPPQGPPSFPPQPPNFPPQQPPQQGPNFPITSPDDGSSQFDDSDSVTVENPEARGRSQQSMQERSENTIMSSQFSTSRQTQRMFPTGAFLSGEEFQARFSSPEQQQQSQQQQPQQRQQIQQQQLSQQQQSEQQQSQRQQSQQQQSQQSQFRTSAQQTEARFLSETPQLSSNSFIPQSLFNNIRSENITPQTRSSNPSVILSTRSRLSEEENMQNQERLIELLTGRNGVAEVRSGVSVESLGEAGQVRTRVLSVTPAPPSANGDERVSTRRIVVSRPIQTLQEVDVVQPFTKLQRVAVQQPALIKTARVGLARVNTLAPVPVASYSPYAYVH